MYIQTTSTTNDFYVDHVAVSRAESGSVVKNNTFENGTSSWYTSGTGTITSESISSQGGSGFYRQSNRTAATHSINANVPKKLRELGTGTYTLCGWVRLSSGTGTVKTAVSLQQSSGTTVVNGPTLAADTTWKAFTGTVNLTWSSTLQDAYVTIDTVGTTADLLIDSMTLNKNGAEALADRDFEFGNAQYWWRSGTGSVGRYLPRGYTGIVHTGRSGTWNSPAQDITALIKDNGPGEYTLGFWGKVGTGTDTIQAVVKIVDSSGTNYYRLPAGLAATNSWKSVSGKVTIPFSGLTNAQLYFETTNATVDLYVDDVTLSKPMIGRLLVTNGDFESGTSGWTAASSAISIVENTLSGNKAIKMSGRTQAYHSPNQTVTTAIQSKGSGDYIFSGWVKLGSGSEAAKATLKLSYSGGSVIYKDIQIPWANTQWQEIKGTFSGVNATDLADAQLYFQTTTSTVDLYVDQVSLSK
ncbi:carbohydrate binding domain-containing protein [Paenibacillus roseipurpureus]|uniref:Carbohydrate binding domain-containing protein n=1 Tax=Paenibacillus roseopurpureus TaxID=2918901 RepID=A0AA96RM66_9BACL|nr:carbohydrate binding domain-containing protein [Paenibacillus sp. MBLB1832]WNR46146.1 carbohydrate binding domain-containing protein [Paenibacillus sp. MBLB1832]